MHKLFTKDVLDITKWKTDKKFHALLCDPPYELKFMSKKWDASGVATDPQTWANFLPFLYPGAFCMAFSSTRTVHRMMVAIEDAGFVIHPMIAWVQGQGFPKATRIKQNKEEVEAFSGHRYGLQALKPSFEPIVVFQKPYEGKPVENMIETGAGAINVDRGRIKGEKWTWGTQTDITGGGYGNKRPSDGNVHDKNVIGGIEGRWPANFILGHTPDCKIIGTRQADSYTINRFTDGAKPWGNGAGHEFESTEIEGGEVPVWKCVDGCPVKAMDEQSGVSTSSGGRSGHTAAYQGGYKQEYYGDKKPGLGDKGGASRFFFQSHWQIEQADPFFYCAKASKKEKNLGLEDMPDKISGGLQGTQDQSLLTGSGNIHNNVMKNNHPTVKPLKLTQYLATLLLPPSEYTPRRILVPFAGTGSEMIGCHLAGWEEVVGIEKEQEYAEIAEVRLKHWIEQK